ncbi:hypothetical protein SJ05684_c35190 [Sinorhizobium sojae CCBAU 05684]|uniref:Uncharacterized protein n=1 Tax=Sinorhizobium sojae CCBAU 05684 TaxID=716928 RepID=A0A249PGP5_9HYPH|nr:hypothetical protein SJ05684_c35190 [Sinorhizobium sojae CCBAU 05684]
MIVFGFSGGIRGTRPSSVRLGWPHPCTASAKKHSKFFGW